MNFIIYNQAGEILRTGTVPEEFFSIQANEGEFILEGEADALTDMIDPATQTVLRGVKSPPEPLPESYADIRRRMYPSTQEQLDMLWHAMDTGLMEKAEPFYSTIKTVKDAVPKDTGTVFIVEED